MLILIEFYDKDTYIRSAGVWFLTVHHHSATTLDTAAITPNLINLLNQTYPKPLTPLLSVTIFGQFIAFTPSP